MGKCWKSEIRKEINEEKIEETTETKSILQEESAEKEIR